MTQINSRMTREKVIRIDIRGGIDLERIVVLVGVLEQTVHRIEDLKSFTSVKSVTIFC